MKCSLENTCSNPMLESVDNQIFCFNCYGIYEKGIKKVIYQKFECCDNPNILKTPIQNICTNCGNTEMVYTEEPSFLENYEYQTNVLYKSKKVHVPYKYLKSKFPEIKFEKIYDFILESIEYIQDFYEIERKPFTKYVPHLYNFYQEKDTNIPIIKNLNENKNLILDQKIIDKLNELYIKHSNSKKIIVNKSKNIKSYNINVKPFDNEEILNKYYYFNKSKNQYFKKTRYCSYLDCYKIANFKKDNIKYCKEHSNNSININDKSTVIKCNYNNCKINIKSDKKYCQNHKFKCLDDECNIRIMKNDSYCKFHM